MVCRKTYYKLLHQNTCSHSSKLQSELKVQIWDSCVLGEVIYKFWIKQKNNKQKDSHVLWYCLNRIFQTVLANQLCWAYSCSYEADFHL